MHPRTKSILTSLITLLSCAAAANAQSTPAAPAFPWEGEVSATNVYVRSGAGSNWYPTMKLSKGDRALVLGEKFGWYQIAPPPGSFSFVDMAMVDRPAGAKKGTIKQDKVYIRAGSQLETRKNSTQVVLNKGDTVDIIGDADGFLKINPPPGAALYISKQYVVPVDARLRSGMVERHVSGKPQVEQKPIASATPPAASTPPTSTPPAVAQTNAVPIPANSAPPKPAITATPPVNTAINSAITTAPPPTPTENAIKIPPSKPVTAAVATSQPANEHALAANEGLALDPVSDLKAVKPEKTAAKNAADAKKLKKDLAAATPPPPQSGRYKTMLTVLESDLMSTLAKPLEQQNVDELLKRYGEIAEQTDEYVPSEIAKIRVRQLNDRAQLKLARIDIMTDAESIAAYRANMDQERMKIMRRRVEKTMLKYDLEGEIWRSYAFAPESKRYRLVDPVNKNTIAYVDIPAETDPNPDHLIGTFVGITTSGQKFSPSARVPIAVATSITDLSLRNRIPEMPQPAKGEQEPISSISSKHTITEPQSTNQDQSVQNWVPAKTDDTPEPIPSP